MQGYKYQEFWQDVDGMRIHAYRSGSEKANSVILLHGGGLDAVHLSWSPFIQPLGEHFQVIAPDLPGYGQSGKPQVTYSLEFYVQFLHAFIKALDIKSASLVGISLGGALAISFALQYPDAVQKLVPVDAYGIMNRYMLHRLSWFYVHSPLNERSYAIYKSRRMTEQVARASGIFYRPERISTELMHDLVEASQIPDAGMAFRSFQRSEYGWKQVRSNLTSQLHHIQAPTLFIHGEKDMAVPLDAAKRAATLVPGARLHIMQDCGHWANREKPEEFLKVLSDFLSK
jgi:pimeloyl-ACP methyl ester carboxylesterase